MQITLVNLEMLFVLGFVPVHFYKGVSPPFTLVKGQPYEEISQSSVNGSICCYKDVLLHVNKEGE